MPAATRHKVRTAPVLNGARNLGELLDALGGVAPERVRMHPAPGTAKPRDVDRIRNREKRLFELIDGVLVEKVMGAKESFLALEIGWHLRMFLEQSDAGFLLGADGMLRILPHQVRIPDLCFVSWDKVGKKEVPTAAIPNLAPNLAVEVLSVGNTPGEMKRKLNDYFASGIELVWFVDPESRTVRVYTGVGKAKTLTESDTLTSGDVLPGFLLPLKSLFARMPAARSSRRRKRQP